MVTAPEGFQRIRKKLNVLGYKEPLGKDSLALVERLLNDLILATRSLQECKQRFSANNCEIEAALRSENESLRSRCSSFNRNLIELQRFYETKIEELNDKIRHLDLSNHEPHLLRSPDTESKQPKNPITVNSPRPNNDPGILVLSSTNTSVAPPVDSVARLQSNTSIANKSSSGVINHEMNESNDLSTLKQRCFDLEKNVLLLQTERDLTEKRTVALRKQIEIRDDEIEQLRKIVEEEKPIEPTISETQQRQANRMIEQLQQQVDLLQMRNTDLEKKLRLQLGTANHSNSVAAIPVSTSHERALQCDLLEFSADNKVNRLDLVEMLDNLERTNNHFLSRTDELVNSQKNMILEIERLKHLVPPAKKQMPLVNRSKKKVTFQKAPSTLSVTSPTNIPSNTSKQIAPAYDPPIKEYIEGLLADREMLHEQINYLNRCLRRWFVHGAEALTVPISTNEDNVEDDTPKAITQTVTTDTLSGAPQRRDVSVGHDYNPEIDEDDDEKLEAVKRERNELQMTLNKFEQNLLEIQDEVRSLRSERDYLLLELEKAPKLNGPVSHPTSLSESFGSVDVKVLNNQRHCNEMLDSNEPQCVTDLGEATRISEHSKTVEQDQKAANPRVINATLDEYRKNMEISQRHANELEQQIEQLRYEMDLIASQKEEAEKGKEQIQTVLAQVRSQNSALASELIMRKNMYNDAVRGKKVSDSTVAEVQRDLQRLSAHAVEMETELRRSREEVSRLHQLTSQQDAEKEALQATLNDRMEDLVTLQNDLAKCTHLLDEKKQILSSTEFRLRQVTEMAAERDREVRTMAEQLKELETSTQVANQSRIMWEEKYFKAKDDVVVLSDEVQSLKARLEGTHNENTDLQSRLKDALQNLSSSDLAMETKLNEYKNLLLQYGSLSKEFEVMSKRNGELERTLAEVEKALQGKEAVVRSHLDRAQKAELEALNAKRECAVAEERCALLGTAAERAESRARQLDGEVEEVRRDLAATRDLAFALQSRLDVAAGHSATVGSDLVTKPAEWERNSHKTSHYRDMVQQLELLLSVARENQVRLQASLDEKTRECEQLQSAHQVLGLAAPEATALHKQQTTNRQHSSAGTGVANVVNSSTALTQNANAKVGEESQLLLFYKPLHPTLSTSSTASLSLGETCITNPASSGMATPRPSSNNPPGSSGDSETQKIPTTHRNHSAIPVVETGMASDSPSSTADSCDDILKVTPAYVPLEMGHYEHDCFQLCDSVNGC